MYDKSNLNELIKLISNNKIYIYILRINTIYIIYNFQLLLILIFQT